MFCCNFLIIHPIFHSMFTVLESHSLSVFSAVELGGRFTRKRHLAAQRTTTNIRSTTAIRQSGETKKKKKKANLLKTKLIILYSLPRLCFVCVPPAKVLTKFKQPLYGSRLTHIILLTTHSLERVSPQKVLVRFGSIGLSGRRQGIRKD